MQQSVSSSSSNEDKNQLWWKVFWNQEIPPKTKIFAWRSFVDALPTGVNLCIRKVKIDWCCPRCNSEAETISHTLLSCSFAKEVWVLTPFETVLNSLPNISIQDCFLEVLRRWGREGLSFFCMVSWCIWWNRNAVVHAGAVKTPAELVSWALSYLSDFRNSLAATSTPHPPPFTLKSSPWIPPPPNKLKLNTDVALKKGLGRVGLGAVIRDSNGWVVGAVAKPVVGNFSPETGELLALREGLILARSLNLKLCVAEVDAYNVASCVSSELTRLDDASCLISDIQSLCQEVGNCACNHIPRSGNGVAHTLARKAPISSLEETWLNTSLPCISSRS